MIPDEDHSEPSDSEESGPAAAQALSAVDNAVLAQQATVLLSQLHEDAVWDVLVAAKANFAEALAAVQVGPNKLLSRHKKVCDGASCSPVEAQQASVLRRHTLQRYYLQSK